jgi:methionine-rich copper-binding protein CopC
VDALPRRAGSHAATLARWLLAIAAVALTAGLAHAHAFPDHAEPRVGSTLDRAPVQVRIWFDGAIEPVFSTMRVETDDRQRVDKGDARVNPDDNRLLEVTVPPLASGRYRVYWSVIARDGHRTEGDFRFRVK